MSEPEGAAPAAPLRTLIVDDEPLAVERMQVICSRIEGISVIGTASDGQAALRLIDALTPDLVLLDLTMPETDGLTVARTLGGRPDAPAVIFVTAHDEFAVEAFDLDAVDYVLKPVAPDRLQRAVTRVVSRRGERAQVPALSQWLDEFWVPHRSELVRVPAAEVQRIDAERDYVRLHVGTQSYLLLQTITSLEERLDPERFIRIHRSCILQRSHVSGLRHEGLGVWSAETADGEALRIGRTYLPGVKKMAGR
ncbi:MULTISPECIES: LytR/AlgR family response regulator transcription factor [Novosphingobium]|jgi:two-component system response regulator AlgR|uniref:Two-component system LytT family response regulator AlgR n=1 Tax=Novosphingobium resinovorum TaxID=158500 RepID=A0A031JYK9_9SPHN|nr:MULTISPECIES: LytTR family DNA-binding domain-containing protein [Novosphingobium]EZP82060.1 Two-component system LytT family response regulator AlgR [Novosphingobium resinovorum]MBF7013146.1 response regulator transcription factor [Novosphingobium sp. HR1a]WJM27873.1 LytTR family DNA-binding domain-containing protein [Novosphingobium resinovorum]GLK44375.1 DNA-binding response regulator [Novosphingobium resinovorum]